MIILLDPYVMFYPQMNGVMKYFYNGGENMLFMTKDERVLFKYSDVWNKLKEIKGIKFHRNHIYDEKYKEAEVREYNGVIKTSF